MNKKFFFVLTLIIIGFSAFAKSYNYNRGVVVSQNSAASEAGVEILNRGGNAFDAAVTTGYALGVTEAQGSGLGGGGFALLYLAKTRKLVAIDFRERAPQKINDYPYEFTLGYRASGVPGMVAGFKHIREKYGKLPLKQDLKPVIRLGEKGFPVSQKLLGSLQKEKDNLEKFNPDSTEFYPGGKIPGLYQRITRPSIARTFKKLSAKGELDFYNGEIARLIISEMDKKGGIITLKDLKNYKVYERTPICDTYRDKHKVCSFPLPSSGGLCITKALKMLENYDFSSMPYNSPERLHILTETMKTVFKDRATSMGEKPETTHYTIVDKDGNIASVTLSLNGAFGSKFGIPGTGIIMNNTLDDFSTGEPNQFMLSGSKLNAPKPGKTPLSSMSPTILFDMDNKPVLALGSPGGPTIINAVLQVILAYTDYKMPINDAVKAGRMHHQWEPDIIFAEDSLINAKIRTILETKYGHKFPESNKYIWSNFYWWVEAVELDNKSHKLIGASDPRAEDGVKYETVHP